MPRISIGTFAHSMMTATLALGVAPKTGDLAPVLAIETLLKGPAGNDLSWEALTGQAVILELWATWCGPCTEAIPHLDEFVEEFSDEPVRFLPKIGRSTRLVLESAAVSSSSLPCPWRHSDDELLRIVGDGNILGNTR